MAKLVSITHKAFRALISKARKSGARDLAENILQNSKPGSGRGVTEAAQRKANDAGRVVLLRNDFKNLARATGLGDGVRITRKGEFEGQRGVRGLEDEIRATRGKRPFKTTTRNGTTTTVMRKGGGDREPKKVYRSEQEDMLAFNRAEERNAARTGRRIARPNDPNSQFYL